MKKYLAIFGAAILVVALASTAALAQFKAFGHMEVMSYWTKNQAFFNKDLEDNRRAVAERFRLHFTYGDPKTVQAYVMFEADSSVYGEPGAPSASGGSGMTGTGTNFGTTGQPGLTNRNHISSYQTDTIGLEIAWAFLDFTVPNTPVTARVGIQRFVIGGDLGRFWMGNDAPGIIATVNFAPHALQAFWWRENTQNTLTANDNDMYGLRYLLKQKMFNVEAWAAYQNDRRSSIESWTMPAAAATSTGTAGNNGAASAQTFTPTRTLTARNYERQPYWIGANVPMTFGNLRIDPTLIYAGGKAVKWFGRDATGVSRDDVKYDAWLADLAMTYRLGPGLSFTAEGFYTTGMDNGKNTKENRFPLPTSSEGRSVFGNGKSIFFFSNTDFGYYGYKSLDPTGMWFARANVEYAPVSWLNLGVNYLWIGDTSKGDAVGAGTASTWAGRSGFSSTGVNLNNPTPYYIAQTPASAGTNPGTANNSPNSIGRSDKNVDNIGQEVNLIATIKIYQNFTYRIAGAYFLPGEAFAGNYQPAGRYSPDHAWNILSNLRYNF